jgi:hypothetical protein
VFFISAQQRVEFNVGERTPRACWIEQEAPKAYLKGCLFGVLSRLETNNVEGKLRLVVAEGNEWAQAK